MPPGLCHAAPLRAPGGPPALRRGGVLVWWCCGLAPGWCPGVLPNGEDPVAVWWCLGVAVLPSGSRVVSRGPGVPGKTLRRRCGGVLVWWCCRLVAGRSPGLATERPGDRARTRFVRLWRCGGVLVWWCCRLAAGWRPGLPVSRCPGTRGRPCGHRAVVVSWCGGVLVWGSGGRVACWPCAVVVWGCHGVSAGERRGTPIAWGLARIFPARRFNPVTRNCP